MKIGLVTGEYPPDIGGVGDHTARLAAHLEGAGHTVEVLTNICTAARASASGDIADETSPRVLRLVRFWNWRALLQVPAIARERGWDVLHIQYQPGAFALNGAINVLPYAIRVMRSVRRRRAGGGARGGPAVVTTFHDLRVPYLFPKAGRLRDGAVAALARGSDAVIAVADTDLERLRHWRRTAPADTTQHVPLGDQLYGTVPDGFDRKAWRARAGIPDGATLVLFFGLLNHSKGVLELVEAVSGLLDAYLVLGGEALGDADPGNATYSAQVSTLIERLGLAGRTLRTGYLTPDDLAMWLAAADVVALPYLDGATLRRTSLIAAWTGGAPVVTTTPPGAAAWVRSAGEYPTALYVAPGDVPGLRAAIVRVAADGAFAASVRAGGLEVATRFAWPEVTDRTVDVYEAALRRV